MPVYLLVADWIRRVRGIGWFVVPAIW